jgi:hypothetical protein
MNPALSPGRQRAPVGETPPCQARAERFGDFVVLKYWVPGFG